MSTYKVGDKVIWDCKAVEIRKIFEGLITEVDDGFGTASGFGFDVAPATERNLEIVEQFQQIKKIIREAEGTLNLNWPDIARKLAGDCHAACMEGSNVKADIGVDRAWEFGRDILGLIAVCRDMAVSDVKLFR